MHESRSDEYDIGFSSEIYFGTHQFSNEFFLNRMSFKRKQAHPQRANGKGKNISDSTVNSQRIGITLKLEIVKKLCHFKVKKKSFNDVLYTTLSLKTRSFTF